MKNAKGAHGCAHLTARTDTTLEQRNKFADGDTR